jgi:hypothetical protein
MARSSTTFGKGDKSASDAGKASTSRPFRDQPGKASEAGSKSGGNFKNDKAAAKDASDAGHQRRWHGNKDE